MTKPTRRWLAAIAVAATALTLAACDGGGEGPTTPPETTATEPSTEPSEDVTTEEPTPAAERPTSEPPFEVPVMAEDSIDGAASTTWFFLEWWNYMRVTGDTGTFEALSNELCNWCATQVEEINELHEAGGWIEGSGLEFDITTARVELPTGEDPWYVVRFSAVLEPYTIVNADGTTVDGERQEFDVVAVGVQYINGSFEVTGVTYEAA